MANSFQTHTGDSATATFSWAQIDGYLSSAHLYLRVNNVLKTITTEYTLNTTAKTVTFLAGQIPSTGDYIEIRRITPKTVSGLVVSFVDASVLTATDMNNSQKQQLFIAQEAQDTGAGGLGLAGTGTSWDAETLRIERVSPPLSLTDAVNKQYVDSIALFGAFTVPQSWSFSGNASTTAFNLTTPDPTCTDPAMFLVEVNGVLQRPVVNYDLAYVGATWQIQFVAAPAAGTNNIVVRNFGVARNALDVLANSSITNQYLGTACVETDNILDLNVTTAKLAATSVTTAKIAALAVTATEIASNAVTTAKILDSNVTTAKINDLAVTTGKINDLAVTTGKVALGSIGNAQIANDSVSLAQLKSAFTGAGANLRAVVANSSGTLGTQQLGLLTMNNFAVPTATVPMNNQTFSGLTSVDWTPSLRFGGNNVGMTFVAGSPTGYSIKIGKLAFFTGRVLLATKGSSTGAASINNLPYTCLGSGWTFCEVMFYSGASGVTRQVSGFIGAGTTSVDMVMMDNAGSGIAALTDANFSNSTAVYFSGCYLTTGA